ncbi:MAG: hypothetical protein ACLFTT_18575 [Candidatus Hydrogenedentota bacterium]
MSVLLWGRESKTLKKRFQRALSPVHAQKLRVIESTLETLRLKVLAERPHIEVLVLAPRSVQELEALAGLRPLLAGLRLILVLPEDGNSCNTVLAHQLTPRYAAPPGSDPDYLTAVLANLLQQAAGKQ